MDCVAEVSYNYFISGVIVGFISGWVAKKILASNVYNYVIVAPPRPQEFVDLGGEFALDNEDEADETSSSATSEDDDSENEPPSSIDPPSEEDEITAMFTAEIDEVDEETQNALKRGREIGVLIPPTRPTSTPSGGKYFRNVDFDDFNKIYEEEYTSKMLTEDECKLIVQYFNRKLIGRCKKDCQRIISDEGFTLAENNNFSQSQGYSYNSRLIFCQFDNLRRCITTIVRTTSFSE